MRDFLAANWARLRPEPETAFKEAFQLAQVRIKEDLMATQPELIGRDGVLYGKYIEEDGEEVEEAADGGTTATVICLLDGMALVHAQVRRATPLLRSGSSPRSAGASCLTTLGHRLGRLATRPPCWAA